MLAIIAPLDLTDVAIKYGEACRDTPAEYAMRLALAENDSFSCLP